jgi:hypothetical protein
MSIESLTYAELGDRLGASPEVTRSLVRRLRLPRRPGKVRVTVDIAEIQYKPLPARSPSGHRADTDALNAQGGGRHAAAFTISRKIWAVGELLGRQWPGSMRGLTADLLSRYTASNWPMQKVRQTANCLASPRPSGETKRQRPCC